MGFSHNYKKEEENEEENEEEKKCMYVKIKETHVCNKNRKWTHIYISIYNTTVT